MIFKYFNRHILTPQYLVRRAQFATLEDATRAFWTGTTGSADTANGVDGAVQLSGRVATEEGEISLRRVRRRLRRRGGDEQDCVTLEIARVAVWRPLRRQGRLSGLLDALPGVAAGADALLIENVVNASLAAALRRRGWAEVSGERRADWEGMRAGRYVAPLNRSFFVFIDELD